PRMARERHQYLPPDAGQDRQPARVEVFRQGHPFDRGPRGDRQRVGLACLDDGELAAGEDIQAQAVGLDGVPLADAGHLHVGRRVRAGADSRDPHRPFFSPSTALSPWWTDAGTIASATAHLKALTIRRTRRLTSLRQSPPSIMARRTAF